MNLQSGESIRVVHPLFQVEGGGSTPTSPLQLHVGEISLDMAIRLNELWHSRLPNVVKNNVQRVRHLACFCAEHDGIYYASAIWTDPIARLLWRTEAMPSVSDVWGYRAVAALAVLALTAVCLGRRLPRLHWADGVALFW